MAKGEKKILSDEQNTAMFNRIAGTPKMETLIVTLGLARPDNTWFEAVVNLEVNDDNFDPEKNLPDEDSDETLAQIAFAQWCSDQVPGGLERGFDRAEAASKVSIPIAGYWVHFWEWAERPDRPCDPDCARVLGNNDSYECTCSRSRNSKSPKG